MRKHNITSVFHYQPLHTSQMGQKLGGRPGDCPVTENIAQTLVRLPFFTTLPLADQERIIDAVLEFQR